MSRLFGAGPHRRRRGTGSGAATTAQLATVYGALTESCPGRRAAPTVVHAGADLPAPVAERLG